MLLNIWNTIKSLASPSMLFAASIFIILVYIFKGGTNFLNIKKVFSDYLKMFNGAKMHLAIFWGVPFLLAMGFVQITAIDSNLSNTLIIFQSILISAFFAMLSILISRQNETNENPLYMTVLKETASVILLEIVLCVVSVIISVATIFLSATLSSFILQIISAANYYIVFVVILNLLIIIKRIKALIDNA